MSDTDTESAELEDAIVSFVKEKGQSTLRSRFFDVGSHEGRQQYAEWLSSEITALNEFIQNEYTWESERG